MYFAEIDNLLMIIVNTPGSGARRPSPRLNMLPGLRGFPAETVLPSFLFAVGNAMSFRIKELAWVIWKIVKRTALIFLFGYLMSWFPFCAAYGKRLVVISNKPHPHFGLSVLPCVICLLR